MYHTLSQTGTPDHPSTSTPLPGSPEVLAETCSPDERLLLSSPESRLGVESWSEEASRAASSPGGFRFFKPAAPPAQGNNTIRQKELVRFLEIPAAPSPQCALKGDCHTRWTAE